MHQQPPALDERTPVRARVLIQKIVRWLYEHPGELVATDKGRLTIHFAGTDIVPQVEHLHEKQ